MSYRLLSVHSVTWYDDYDFNHNGSDDVTYEADTEHFPNPPRPPRQHAEAKKSAGP